ncbi:MAG: sn-glycerol-3-phosphate ABC transporter ATP-binding protein UgpC [Candidatus Gastranaerophilales bacterium]|nr:sn-glycerol-3-phosphate ABC transporter ATP-binding protein UgpC [Candidatus Gastranaerophilales bacterium]
MAKVELKNVSKIYDNSDKKVINKVSLSIEDKEFLVLVGSSGCGKSTLLRMIAGLENITDGEIFIEDKCVNNIHPKDRDIAFVFQSYALYPHMTVFENIAFPLKMRGYKKDEIKEKVLKVAGSLDLDELLDRKPKQLSGGQRQRVALGRAIVREPKVFLMDEPLSNLDAKLRVQMRAEIKKLHQKLQTTFIYVTHDQTEALTMGDRIAVIDKGIIQQVDTPDKIYNLPANTFVGGFLGSPAMNFIPSEIIEGAVEINGVKIYLNDEQKHLLSGYNEVLIGIRAENLSEYVPNCEFKAPVDISEMLGSERVVYFIANGKKCCAKMPPMTDVSGDITLKADSNKFLFFDTKTLNRI